jgi:hypothetical protein
MGKLWSQFRRISGDSLEILRHALIGGCVAVAIVLFHALLEQWIGQPDPFAHKRYALFLIGLFVLIFAAIALLEYVLYKLQWNARIPLQQSDEFIDGRWIEVIVENGKRKEGSIVTIKGARGQGFTLTGASYPVDDHGHMSRKAWGKLKSGKGSLFADNGISFHVSGKRGQLDHFGVGYYQFGEPAKETCFEGAFVVRQEKAICHVIGRKVDDHIPLDDVLSILEDFLKSDDVQNFVTDHA